MALKDIFLIISLTIMISVIIWFTYLDIRHRELGAKKRNSILLLYPLAMYVSWDLYGFTINFFLGLFLLFFIMYGIEIIAKLKGWSTNSNFFGSIDILMAPIYTCLFGFYTIIFIYLCLIACLIMCIKPVKKLFSMLCINKQYENTIPMLVAMSVAYFTLFSLTFIR